MYLTIDIPVPDRQAEPLPEKSRLGLVCGMCKGHPIAEEGTPKHEIEDRAQKHANAKGCRKFEWIPVPTCAECESQFANHVIRPTYKLTRDAANRVEVDSASLCENCARFFFEEAFSEIINDDRVCCNCGESYSQHTHHRFWLCAAESRNLHGVTTEGQ